MPTPTGPLTALDPEDLAASVAFEAARRPLLAQGGPDPRVLADVAAARGHARHQRENPQPTDYDRQARIYQRYAPVPWYQWPQGQPSYASLETGNPTVKWRGLSMTSVRDAQSSLRVAQTRLQEAARRLAAAEANRQKTVETLLGIPVTLGSQECPDSPTLECVYPVLGDPRHRITEDMTALDGDAPLTEAEEHALEYAADRDRDLDLDGEDVERDTLDAPGTPLCLFCRHP